MFIENNNGPAACNFSEISSDFRAQMVTMVAVVAGAAPMTSERCAVGATKCTEASASKIQKYPMRHAR